MTDVPGMYQKERQLLLVGLVYHRYLQRSGLHLAALHQHSTGSAQGYMLDPRSARTHLAASQDEDRIDERASEEINSSHLHLKIGLY